MTYKNTKTILFASLIVAMILPFSGMQSANATHGENGTNHINDDPYNYEDRQERLVTMLNSIDGRIDTTRDDEKKEQLESVKQRILAKLVESSLHQNGAIEIDFVYPMDELPSPINFSIEGDNLGCDGVIESWSYQVETFGDQDGFVLIAQDFPDILTSGISPNCERTGWIDSIHLEMQPVFSGEGCYRDIETASTANYALECETLISGLWIVGITFTYGSFSETQYTYAYV